MPLEIWSLRKRLQGVTWPIHVMSKKRIVYCNHFRKTSCADVNKCQSKSSTSDQSRVKGKFVKKGTASRSNRLKYFNKVMTWVKPEEQSTRIHAKQTITYLIHKQLIMMFITMRTLRSWRQWQKTVIFHGGTAGG